MAGRGRGRGGAALSLTQDQMQALGITRQDNTTPCTPPPLFPKLQTKPLPLNCDATTDYMLIVKDQFIEYLHESPAFVKAKTRTDGVERYSDKYKVLAQDAKKGKILDCNWTNMPSELKPQANRIRTVARKRKLEDPADIDKRLQTLEKKETLEGEENMETTEDGAAAKKVNDDEELEDEHEQEDELDDGTDYANNYFDNGEDYDEEDDNLDDGPVY